MTETDKKERVSIPELRALIFEINKEYFYSEMPMKRKRMFSLPSGKLRNPIILKYHPGGVVTIVLIVDERISKTGWEYDKTYKFDYPRLAKEFLVEELNSVIKLNSKLRESSENK